MWELHPKGVHHMCLKILLYGDHSLKTIKFPQWCSQYTSHFFIFETSYSHMIFLQVLIAINNTKLLNANYEPKAPIITLYILEGKNGWIVNHIHLHIFPMYQTNHLAIYNHY